MASSVKLLLTTTAVIEIGTGVVLLLAPSLTANVLFGAALASPVARLVGRIGGGALLAIGLTCWLERTRVVTTRSNGLLPALLLYNAVVAVLVVRGAFIDKMDGVGVWPVVVVHSVMFVWCAARLRTE